LSELSGFKPPPATPTLDSPAGAVSRTFALGEPTKLEFRWETFNLLNRTNFDLPNRTFSTSTANFGRIFSAKSPREMQFGLRLSF